MYSFNCSNILKRGIMNKLTAKRGFTLAEVLITLGIVGVVAAITLPTLMTKISENVHKAQLRKVVSTLNQALKMVYNNTDVVYECYYGADGVAGSAKECGMLNTEMQKVLKVSHVCKNNAYKNGCIPKYKGLDNILKEKYGQDYDLDFSGKNCRHWFENEILNNGSVIVLLDGTIIGQYYNNSPQYIYVDVNGAKGPNKWGYDIFHLGLRVDKKGEPYYYSDRGGCDFTEKGGKRAYQMLEGR